MTEKKASRVDDSQYHQPSATASANEAIRATSAPHSPLPWYVVDAPDMDAPMVHSASDPVAQVYGGAVRVSQMAKLPSQRRTNAHFIVTACNSHHDLLAALKEIDASVHSHIDGRDLLDELHPRHHLDIVRRIDARETRHQGDWLSTLRVALRKARAVIAKAEGR